MLRAKRVLPIVTDRKAEEIPLSVPDYRRESGGTRLFAR